ncbi:MAG TPA: hypothetical protein VJ484_04210 [Lysobacter sp.]|nr:hypothetical protein [Lysobacter sp.]
MNRHIQRAVTIHPTPAMRIPPGFPLGAIALAIGLGGASSIAWADEPCGDLSECRVLIEINTTDGDIGFHALFDSDGWKEGRIDDPDGKMIFKTQVTGSLRDQSVTENFFESAEQVCEESLAEDPDDVVVTLPEFLERFPAGSYDFRFKLADGGQAFGATELTHVIPPAPADVDFDGREISWSFGDDLGECTTLPPGFQLADETDIVAYEVVMEPEDPAFDSFLFVTQVPNGTDSVTVPLEYLASLPANTPLKVEVGAIELRPNGSFGNQTFSEEDGFCNNLNQQQCPEGAD